MSPFISQLRPVLEPLVVDVTDNDHRKGPVLHVHNTAVTTIMAELGHSPSWKVVPAGHMETLTTGK